MLPQRPPKNARAKRALDHRAPKEKENPKTCLFLRGSKASQVVQDCLTDLHAMRKPFAKKFTKNNAIHPFEDAASLEFFSRKNDASLQVFGSSSKKRPHSLTLCRTFDHRMLDMAELYVDPATFRRLGTFAGPDGKKRTFPVSARPLLLFAGAPFAEAEYGTAGNAAAPETARKYALVKNLLTDFFRNDSTSDKIAPEGLTHIVSVTAPEAKAAAAEGLAADAQLPVLHIRVYALRTLRSGQRLPRVELDEVGPRLDVRIGRVKEPDTEMLKEALRQPKTAEARTKKNIETDGMGDKIGRIHVGKQDISELQTRKMKGLKRSRDEGRDGGGGGGGGANDGDGDGDDDDVAVVQPDGITGVVRIKNDFSKKIKTRR